MTNNIINLEVGFGNVYKDLGFKDHETMIIKANLVSEINNILKSRKLNRKEAAKIIGIDELELSKLINGIMSEFTIDRLLKYKKMLSS